LKIKANKPPKQEVLAGPWKGLQSLIVHPSFSKS